jgi:antitoxin VapB
LKTTIETKLFKNGGSKAVRIPAAWNFDSENVLLTFNEVTNSITITRKPKGLLDDFFELQDRLGPISKKEWGFKRDQGIDDFKSPFKDWK